MLPHIEHWLLTTFFQSKDHSWTLHSAISFITQPGERRKPQEECRSSPLHTEEKIQRNMHNLCNRKLEFKLSFAWLLAIIYKDDSKVDLKEPQITRKDKKADLYTVNQNANSVVVTFWHNATICLNSRTSIFTQRSKSHFLKFTSICQKVTVDFGARQ